MADVIVVGGGVAGLCGAMLLARDGHQVRLLERDPDPPPPPDEAWDRWTRRGVNQFSMLHFFLPRFRELVEAELPELAAALVANGALRTNPLTGIPAEITGGARPDDDRFTALTGRRPFVEAIVAAAAAAEPGLEVVRGAAVTGLLTGPSTIPGVPHVVGVVTAAGDELRADLVVDASGRRSALPQWLAALGARPPYEELEDCGFIYYGRHFSSTGRLAAGGARPAPAGVRLGVAAAAAGRQRHVGHRHRRQRVRSGDAGGSPPRRVGAGRRQLPAGRPLVGRQADLRRRRDGQDRGPPPALRRRRRTRRHRRRRAGRLVGVHEPVGRPRRVDRACSTPCACATSLREVAPDDPAFAARWDEITGAVVEPLYRDTLAFDRHRLAEIDAQIAGVPYETDDPGWRLGQALGRSATSDPDLLRASISIASLLERGVDVLARPGIVDRILALDPGPGRAAART